MPPRAARDLWADEELWDDDAPSRRRAQMRAVENGEPAERRTRISDRPNDPEVGPAERRSARITGQPNGHAPAGRRTVRITGQPTPPRRRRTSAQIESRPDRVALWAVLLGLFLVFMAAATAKAAPWSHATLGERVLNKGDRGSDVQTLQRVLRLKGYGLSADGVFGPQTRRTVKRFQRRRHIGADGVVGPITTRSLAATWGAKRTTIFGPGLYGNRTACGHTLAHRTRGLAHRSLPCGKSIGVYHGGRIVLLPVIDRGPFTRGVSFDVTAAGARKLGIRSTTSVRAGY